jgi:hypothetical protein
VGKALGQERGVLVLESSDLGAQRRPRGALAVARACGGGLCHRARAVEVHTAADPWFEGWILAIDDRLLVVRHTHLLCVRGQNSTSAPWPDGRRRRATLATLQRRPTRPQGLLGEQVGDAVHLNREQRQPPRVGARLTARGELPEQNRQRG